LSARYFDDRWLDGAYRSAAELQKCCSEMNIAILRINFLFRKLAFCFHGQTTRWMPRYTRNQIADIFPKYLLASVGGVFLQKTLRRHPMKNTDRRSFLKLMSIPAAAAALPASIARALAIDANNRTGTIADVKHIVFLMQENRSFDHYFGTMRGVRGFADPRAVKLPSGQPVWYQPNDAGYLLPFRPDVDNLGGVFLQDLPHGWTDQHAAWNEGNYDQWVPAKSTTTMAYLTRKDLPYHYALADAFTVCDAYHCSVLGPTDPNRYHMWTGWLGNDGNGGGPVITNAEAGYDWSTYPERLDNAGISWKVYQDIGDGLDGPDFWGWTSDPYIGNYGDNSLLYFHQYQNALPGSPLYNGAKVGTNIATQSDNPVGLLDMFRNDVNNGKLPQVSWIVAPEAYTEHPNWTPNLGAWYMSQFLDILTSNPDVFSKTVVFVNYDENDGFFDHMVPPTPPQSRSQGLSTVETTNDIFPGNSSFAAGPYGLGVRVPMIVVSPWSRGGYVNSQVFDHTSLIRFLEARFAGESSGLIETNITPWRRTVAGDLTSAFDFANPNRSSIQLPGTDSDEPTSFLRYPDFVPVPPSDQSLPEQERGSRPARPLPYVLNAHGSVHSDGFLIDFENSGKAGVVFQVRSGNGMSSPRTYTVEPEKRLSDSWTPAAGGPSTYDLAVHGPNGFLRAFKGNFPQNGHTNTVDVRAVYNEQNPGITLALRNHGSEAAEVKIHDNYSGESVTVALEVGASASKSWSLSPTSGWYDFVVNLDGDSAFEYQLAGHVETGNDSISDPAMGGSR
jgi:phospholipase C